MRVIAAPDSFKGSASADELCASISRGVKRVYPDAIVSMHPLADGGEGTAELLVRSTFGTWREVTVSDPLGRPVQAAYGVLGDGKTAVIEMARASGLPLLKDEERNPLVASSRGTGELIRNALDMGFRSFIIGLGGSATNDGGMGLLRALGMEFYGADGERLAEGGGSLRELVQFDESGLDTRLTECSFRTAGDVTNPLVGPNGASAVFGPQKGADAIAVARLDEGLNKLADLIFAQKGLEVREMEGGGAAGGIAASLAVFLHSEIHPGIDLILQATGFEAALENADFVVTGEGRLDEQTLSGKTIAGVCRYARKYGVPVLGICGGKELTANELDELGLTAAFSAVQGPCSLQEAIPRTTEWVEETTLQLFRLVRATGFTSRH
ncbi:glycerate kinase [Cohnella abietis]|uniref:Glycerate kinase n=1 Tax=Cohnella abietis TaxID=2507935 RepID=A0A3T1CZM5_9BACL|nr:glycerate kinase [Cohnella abietis]BBI31284.1 glycerate kinase [Cohnella abietis]